jgi:large subunit ribosomal protein L18
MSKTNRNEARLRRHVYVRKHISGTTEKPRMNVFRSLQEIDDEAGCTLAAASTLDTELRDQLKGLKKTEQAKLVGKLVATRALEKKIKTVVFDRGGFKYIGRVKALAEGAREAGLIF